MEAYGLLCGAIVKQAQEDIRKYNETLTKPYTSKKARDARLNKEKQWAEDADKFLKSVDCETMKLYFSWADNLRSSQIKLGSSLLKY